MKKLFLGLGTITAVAVPIVMVISCDTTNEETKYFTQKDGGITRYFKVIFGHNHGITGRACSTIEISEIEYKIESGK